MVKVEVGKKDMKGVQVTVVGKYLSAIPDARKVAYDNAESGLDASSMQDAVDEIAGKVGQRDADISIIKADVAELERGLAEEAEARIKGEEQARSYIDYKAGDLGRRIDNTNSSVSAVADEIKTYKSATDERLESLEESSDALERSLGNKQDTLVSGENIKTINGQPLVGSGNVQIEGGGETGLSGKLNLADLSAVRAAQNGLGENEVRFFVITDSEGKIPSTQKCYDVPSDVVRQMSLKTGNSIVDLALNSVEVEPIGVSVGDLIALTKVSVELSDLAEAVGVNISLSGSMLIYQYKILHTSGAREENYEEGCTKGVYGLLSPWDKQLIEGSAKPTRYGYGHNLDDMLQSGVLAYTSATIDGVTANWSIFVDCSASPDGGGFYHLTQTAIGRDAGNLGEVYMRLGYYQKGSAPTFTPWRHTTSSGSGGGGYEPPIGGIPRADLSADVQASLGKADTALQVAFAENLLLNTRFSNNAEKWDGSNYQVVNDVHGRGVSGVKLNNGYMSQPISVEEGYYTLSFWHTGRHGENYVRIPGDCEDVWSDLGAAGGSGEYILPDSVTPKKYTICIYAYNDTFPISFEAGGEMSISEVKFEKSKKAL